MTRVSASAGVAHSKATSAPASHILCFMAWRPFLPERLPSSANSLPYLRFQLQVLLSSFPKDSVQRDDASLHFLRTPISS
jgi:hypothetical protein